MPMGKVQIVLRRSQKDLAHILARHHCPQGQYATRKTFSPADDIRGNSEGLGPEHLAGLAVGSYDLVVDQ